MDVCLWNGERISAFEYSKKFVDETEIRQASYNGELRCVDNECNEIMSFKHGEKREAHFAHRHGHGRCAYEEYIKHNDGIIHKTKEVLYYFLDSNGYDVRVDENLIGRHYTPLIVNDNNNLIAIEIATKSYTERQIRETDELYRNNGIKLLWFVSDETVNIKAENSTYYVKRFMLNTDMLIVVNPYEEEILAAKLCDFNYDGKIVSDVFQCKYVLGKLFFENGAFIIENFESDCVHWCNNKQKYYNNKYQKFLEEEKRRHEAELELERLSEERKKENEKLRMMRQEKAIAKRQKYYVPIENIEIKKGNLVGFPFWNKNKFNEFIFKLSNEYKNDTSDFNILIRKLYECSDEEYKFFMELFEDKISKTDEINEDMVYIMETAIKKVNR